MDPAHSKTTSPLKMLSRLKLLLSASILGLKDAVALKVEVLEAVQEGKRTGTKSATQRRLGLTPHQRQWFQSFCSSIVRRE
jgi:hypothetical protein